MGELWLMGAQLIGLPIQHCVRREGGVDHRSIAAQKHVRESYWIRLLTAGGDVFGNLILTQRNSVIVLPQEWTRSSWGNSITAVESEFCTCCRCKYGQRCGYIFAFQFMHNATKVHWNINVAISQIFKAQKPLCALSCMGLRLTPPNWYWRNQTGSYS